MSDFLNMGKYLTILFLMLVCTTCFSCKAKKEVIIPDKDNAKIQEKPENQLTYEQALKKHWAMQSKESKSYAKDNLKRSSVFNAPKKLKKKAKACNNCADSENAVMDGVRDFK